MLAKYTYDPRFQSTSKELKRVLQDYPGIPLGTCIDMPCGNGRNIFFLSTVFKNVMGVDINKFYLAMIMETCFNQSSHKNIITREADLSQEIPAEIIEADFICSIHYYNYSFLSGVISKMKSGAFLYIETPDCFGENYKELPLEAELNYLFKETEVVSLKPKTCKSSNSTVKTISFKALLKKEND